MKGTQTGLSKADSTACGVQPSFFFAEASYSCMVTCFVYCFAYMVESFPRKDSDVVPTLKPSDDQIYEDCLQNLDVGLMSPTRLSTGHQWRRP